MVLIDDWTKPMIVKFIKNTRDFAVYLTAQSIHINTPDTIRIKIALPEADLREKIGKDIFCINYSENDVYFEALMDEVNYNTVFLNENWDGALTTADNVRSIRGDWDKLYQQVKMGLYPTIYLQTAHSDVYHPAYYSMDRENKMGKLGCMYMKEINGKKYLVNDELIFPNGNLGLRDLYTPVYTEIPLE